MREPTREEIIEGIALGFQRFLDQHYGAPYRHLSEDIMDAITQGTEQFLKLNPPSRNKE